MHPSSLYPLKAQTFWGAANRSSCFFGLSACRRWGPPAATRMKVGVLIQQQEKKTDVKFKLHTNFPCLNGKSGEVELDGQKSIQVARYHHHSSSSTPPPPTTTWQALTSSLYPLASDRNSENYSLMESLPVRWCYCWWALLTFFCDD